MNGELYHIARSVNYVNYSLKTNDLPKFKIGQYESQPEFVLDHKKSFSDAENETITGVEEWIKSLLEKKLRRVALFVSVSDNPGSAGFSNAGSKCIITEFGDGTSSNWYPRWLFDSANTIWNIQYFELSCGPAPTDPRLYGNNVDEFKEVLQKIEVFANEIKFENFARIFKEAYDYLANADEPKDADYVKADFPGLSGDALRLFMAAYRADVFGGMGSWNDVGYEEEKDEEYQRLSNKLYAQIRKAVMFAVNN